MRKNQMDESIKKLMDKETDDKTYHKTTQIFFISNFTAMKD